MVEEGTLDGSPKGGGKEELGKGEWILLNTLSLKKTKIWQDHSTSLELKRREERRFFCVLEWRKHYKKNGLLRRSKTAAKAQKSAAKGPFDL